MRMLLNRCEEKQKKKKIKKKILIWRLQSEINELLVFGSINWLKYWTQGYISVPGNSYTYFLWTFANIHQITYYYWLKQGEFRNCRIATNTVLGIRKRLADIL